MKKLKFLCLFLAFVISFLMLFSCAAGMEKDSQNGEYNNETEVSGTDMSSRKLVKNATLYVETKEFDTLHEKLNEAIKSLEGYVESKQVNGTGDSDSSMRYATIVTRIPAESLDAFIAAVKDAGNVTSETTSVKDVTLSYIDVESRLKALRTEEEALLSLLEKAESIDTIITIQSRLTEVRASIEDYESRIRVLEDAIDYSTVTLYIDEVEHITVTEKTSIWTRIGNNLSDGFKNVWIFLKELFVFVLSAIPYIILIGVFAGLILLILKFVNKKKNNNNKGNGNGIYPPPVK